ncbi:MAG: TetR/AcrR family transcriptional regulator [Nocardiaceae bacterium]|nr:TetR/AcrR family transcriptional regulator [Nocardiaceae bacterium]
MTDTVEAGRPARPAGRPRSAEADEAIISAALELVANRGIGAVSIEAIAAAAGVGKTTIYRRWENKEALIVDALASIQDPPPALAGTSARDDLVLLVDYIRRHNEALSSKLMACVVTEASDELRDVYLKHIVEPRRELMREVLRDGIANGELIPDLDIELTLSLLSGPMLTMVKIWKLQVAPDTAERIVDAVLNGIARR